MAVVFGRELELVVGSPLLSFLLKKGLVGGQKNGMTCGVALKGMNLGI